MTRCPMSPTKHRIAKPHGSHSHGSGLEDYKFGMRGCAWKKLIRNDIHIGRCCERCGKKIFNPRCNI